MKMPRMIVAAAASMIAIAAQAETNLEAATWIGGASGLWDDASNWSGGGHRIPLRLTLRLARSGRELRTRDRNFPVLARRPHARLRALLLLHRRQPSCLHESHTVSFRRQLYHTRIAAAYHKSASRGRVALLRDRHSPRPPSRHILQDVT